jgi:sugar lactone lactonase YvrE
MKLNNWIFNLIILTTFQLHVQGQEVSTYAGIPYIGNGEYVTSRNNPLLGDYYSNPTGIIFDHEGRMVFTDEHNLMMIIGDRSVNRIGTPLDPLSYGGFADGAATSGLFNAPKGLALHPTDNHIYICDFANHSIRKAEPYVNSSNTQMLTTFAGNGPSSNGHADGPVISARFNNPFDIVIAQNGDMYISDQSNHVIRKISNGVVSTIAGKIGVAGYVNGIGNAAEFRFPGGLMLDQNDSVLLVADVGNRSIRKIQLYDAGVSDFLNTGLFTPRSITKVNTTYFICDASSIKIWHKGHIRDFAGSSSEQGDQDGFGTEARFYALRGIVYDAPNKCLFVADQGINTLKKISLPDSITTTQHQNDTSLQTRSLSLSPWNIYPNPSNGVFQVTNNTLTQATQYFVYNGNGQLVAEGLLPERQTQYLHLEHLHNGLYYISFMNQWHSYSHKIHIHH